MLIPTQILLKFSITISIILQTLTNASSRKIQNPKCCDSESVLKLNGSNIECTKIAKKLRIDIVTENIVHGTNRSDYCTEILDGEIGNFELNSAGNGFIKLETLLDIDYLPKCCPQNYFYNPRTHSCDETNKPMPKCFRDSFIKIGLPNCKIIEDLSHEIQMPDTCPSEIVDELKAKYNNETRFCIDRDENNAMSIVRVCRSNYEVCKSKKCVRKCCPDGQSFVGGSFCKDTFTHGMDLDFPAIANRVENSTDPFVIVTGYRSVGIYRLIEKFKYHLDAGGDFHMQEKDNISRRYNFDAEEYCIEHFQKGNAEGYSFFRPFATSSIPTKFVFTRYAMLISSFFLLITMTYYCCSQEKRTVFGKTLISYCIATLALFVNLSYNAFDTRFNEKICIILAFILIYSSLSSFTWLNIMCIDIYCTFGSPKSFSSLHHRSKEVKRFILYSLYGWGAPLVLTTIPLIFYHVDVLPSSLGVLLDASKCFLKRGYGLLLFSAAPVSVMQISNVIFFLRTITYCLKVKGEISKMNDTHVLKGDKKRNFEKYKDRLGLLLKLFLIMGVSFIFEMVTQLYDFKQNATMRYIELVGDTFNSLQGLFVFLIFICKPRVLKKFQKKIGLSNRIRKFSLISSNATQTTTVSSSLKNTSRN